MLERPGCLWTGHWTRSNQEEVKKKEEEEEGKEEVLKMMSQGGDMTVGHRG